MRKLLTCFTVFLLSAWGATAQDFGVKAGVNATNMSNADLKTKLSFHVGMFSEWQLNEFVSLQPEVVYSRQGARDKLTEDGKKVRTRLRMNYLNIPVLAKLYVLKHLSVDLGPQFGFVLDARYKQKDSIKSLKTKLTNYKNFDFSWAMGASFRIDSYDISARYNIGLTNMFTKSDSKNRVFQVSLGYVLSDLF